MTTLATRLSLASLKNGLVLQAQEQELRTACKAIEARLLKSSTELGKPFELELTPRNKRLTIDELDALRGRLLAQQTRHSMYAATDAGKAAKAKYDEDQRLAAEKLEKTLERLIKLGSQLPTDPCSIESLEVLVVLRRRALYDECVKLCKELTRLASEKRVPSESLLMPDDRRMSDDGLLKSLKGLKRHRLTIEDRSRELRRNRISNPSKLKSPITAT